MSRHTESFSEASVNVWCWFTTCRIWSDMMLDLLTDLCFLCSHFHGYSQELLGHAADKIFHWVMQCVWLVCLWRLMTSTHPCLAETLSCKIWATVCLNNNTIRQYRPVRYTVSIIWCLVIKEKVWVQYGLKVGQSTLKTENLPHTQKKYLFE